MSQSCCDQRAANKLRSGQVRVMPDAALRSGVPLLIGGKWEELPSILALQKLQDPSAGSLPAASPTICGESLNV